MFEIKHPTDKEIPVWTSLDKHINAGEVKNIVNNKHGYFITTSGLPVGVLRYTIFWDNIPFINYMFIKDGHRKMGVGTEALTLWENEMRKAGYKHVLVSSQSDEKSQNFYRKMGYKDCGCLILDFPGRKQPTELFFAKEL